MKSTSAGVNVYAGDLYEEQRANGTVTSRFLVMFHGKAVAVIERQSTNCSALAVYYLHKDQVGSPILITDDSGAAVSSRTFDPFGKMTSETGRAMDGRGLGFGGHEYDRSPAESRTISAVATLRRLEQYAWIMTLIA